MRRVVLRGIGFLFLGIALFSLFAATLIFALPGAKSSLLEIANDEYAPRMVPIMLAHEPQLSTLTYENTAAYCRHDGPGVSQEFAGISDEYVCSLIQNNYVSNTEELRLRLARALISIKADGITADYGMQIASFQSYLLPLAAACVISAFLSFTFVYFGSKGMLGLAFSLASAAAAISFIIFLISVLSFFLLPPYLISMAKGNASTPFEMDLISASQDLVAQVVGEVFLIPMALFGILSIASGLSASSAYYYLTGTKN
ncbi:MAG: hypothetical protein PHQ80_03205 [Candidatus ainarchaeum sp.]|nr:hypothetical protein [Candidatus ainarchaeum sp.]MDD5096132.1 hypothetical protein [Candidatus ainarchaeum sp.]